MSGRSNRDGRPSLPVPFAPVKVYQDFSIRASRSLNNDLELLREWLDNSMAPGSARNTPPDSGPLKITVDIVDKNGRRVLVYTDNGQSVQVQHLDNLLCYGHKNKTSEVRAQMSSNEATGTQTNAIRGSSSNSINATEALAVYGEIGQGLPMTMTALAAISYLFFRQANGTTFVMAYGQAIKEPDGTTCRAVLVLPNKDPGAVTLEDLIHPENDDWGYDNAYAMAVTRSIGYFFKEHYKEERHGKVVPLYQNIKELMLRSRDVPEPGVMFDVMLMDGTSLKVQDNPRTKLPDVYSTTSNKYLTDSIPQWYLPGPRQGCDLGAHISPALPDKDVEICVQGSAVDRFSQEPWCRGMRQDAVITTDVMEIDSKALGLGVIRMQVMFWPRSLWQPSSQTARAAGLRQEPPPSTLSLPESDDPSRDDPDVEVLVDDETIPGMRIFQSSDRAVWMEEGKVPSVYRHRTSFAWCAARSARKGGGHASDYIHFLKMCGLKDQQAALALGLPSKDAFSDIKGYAEKDVKYWLMLNNMLTYVMLDRKKLHDLKLLKDTKDDLVDNDTSQQLFHLIYRGIATRIWVEKDRIRESMQPTPAVSQRCDTMQSPVEPPETPAGATKANAAYEACGDAGPSGTSPGAPQSAGPVSFRLRQGVRKQHMPQRTALQLAIVPFVLSKDNRRKSTPETPTYSTPKRQAPPSSSHKAKKARQSKPPDEDAANELLDTVMKDARELKKMLKDPKHGHRPNRKAGLEKSAELYGAAKSVHELVEKIFKI